MFSAIIAISYCLIDISVERKMDKRGFFNVLFIIEWGADTIVLARDTSAKSERFKKVANMMFSTC